VSELHLNPLGTRFQKAIKALNGSLKILDLDYIQISSFVDASIFQGLANLERLVISRNSLGGIPYSLFNGLSKLKDLDMSYNYLTAIPNLRGLYSLQNLLISGNRLTTNNYDTFRDLNNLTKIYLDSNDLESFGLPALPSLTSIFLGSNRLKSLSKELVTGKPQLI
jgi:Leucine-rich repeat (LRR) protein